MRKFTLCQGVVLECNEQTLSNYGYHVVVDGLHMGTIKARAYDEYDLNFPDYNRENDKYYKMKELFRCAKEFLIQFDHDFNRIYMVWCEDYSRATAR